MSAFENIKIFTNDNILDEDEKIPVLFYVFIYLIGISIY